MIKRPVLIFCLLVLTACASVDVSYHPQHVRELSVLLVTDGSVDVDKASSLISEASNALEPQAGIKLLVTGHMSIQWVNHYDLLAQLNELYNHTSEYPQDLVIAFRAKTAGETVQMVLFGGIEGMIDDTFRRYIIMPSMSKHALMHEVCHSLIFTHAHDSGLMSAFTLSLIPGVPLIWSDTLSRQDRLEIQGNIGRNFKERVPVNEGTDVITSKASEQ
jgi:hypothetical protein